MKDGALDDHELCKQEVKRLRELLLKSRKEAKQHRNDAAEYQQSYDDILICLASCMSTHSDDTPLTQDILNILDAISPEWRALIKGGS